MNYPKNKLIDYDSNLRVCVHDVVECELYDVGGCKGEGDAERWEVDKGEDAA